jgi:hypothetical protein
MTPRSASRASRSATKWERVARGFRAFIKARTEAFRLAILRLNFYSHDFRVELQNALLSELFEQQTSRRLAGHYVPFVIRLDRFEELQAEFSKHPAWVQYNNERGTALNANPPI